MEQLRQIFEKLFESFTDLFPNLLGSIVLVGVGWVIAKALATITQGVLRAVKADKLTEKLSEVDVFANANVDLKLSTLLSKTIFYFIFLTFIIAATEFLGLTIISQQVSDMLNFIPKAIAAFMVFLVGVIFVNFLRNIIDTTFRSLNIPSAKLISGFIFYFLLMTIGITALSQTGMDTDFLTSNIQIILIGMVVAFSVGFGLSSRPILKNILASGYTKQKFMIGITLKIGEIEGEVIDIDS